MHAYVPLVYFVFHFNRCFLLLILLFIPCVPLVYVVLNIYFLFEIDVNLLNCIYGPVVLLFCRYKTRFYDLIFGAWFFILGCFSCLVDCHSLMQFSVMTVFHLTIFFFNVSTTLRPDFK